MSPPPSRSQVTALLPAWQAAEFIQPTLDCLSAQDWPAFDVIVSVDQCDDDTHAICTAHAARDARFRVIAQQQRLGYVGNCNALLAEARSDYVLFAFHDDVLAADYVTRLAQVLDVRPEVVMSYSDLLLHHTDGRQEHCTFSALEGEQDRLKRGMTILQWTNNWWVPNRGLFRLEAARRIGGLKTHGAGEFSADLPWLFHMALIGGFARVPETLCFKYYKPGSLSRGWEFSKHQQHEVMASCMRELWNAQLQTGERLMLSVPLLQWLAKNAPEANAQ